MSSFIYASSSEPCQVCSATKDCRRTNDGLHLCHTFRHGEQPGRDFRPVGQSKDGLWGMFVRGDLDYKPRPKTQAEIDRAERRAEWDAKCKQVKAKLEAKKRQAKLDDIARVRDNCASALEADPKFWAHSLPGLDPNRICQDFDFRWSQPDRCFVIDELAGDHRLVAQHRRYMDGRKLTKGFDPNQGRGLVVPRDHYELFSRADQGVFCVEGLSDTITLFSHVGVAAVGRPSCRAGGDDIAQLLSNLPDDVPIYVVGENDRSETRLNKKTGEPDWPGRDGAIATASKIAALLQRDVYWVLVPEGTKDARDWLSKQNLPASDPGLKRLWVDHCLAHAQKVNWGEAAVKEYQESLSAQEQAERAYERALNVTIADLDPTPKQLERNHQLREQDEYEAECRREQKAIWEDHRRLKNSLPRADGCGLCVTQVNPVTSRGHILETRCCQWTGCDLCRELNVRSHKRLIASNFGPHTEIYAALIDEIDLGNKTRQINRRGERYKAIRQPDDKIWLFSTHQFTDSNECTAREAVRLAERAIDQIPHTKHMRPVTSSREWKKKQKPRQEYQKIATWGHGLSAIQSFLAQFREIQFTGTLDNFDGEPIIRKSRFVITCGLSPEIMDNLKGWLSLNSEQFSPEEWILPPNRSLLTPPPSLNLSSEHDNLEKRNSDHQTGGFAEAWDAELRRIGIEIDWDEVDWEELDLAPS